MGELNGDRQTAVTIPDSGGPTVFRGTEYSVIRTTVALVIWLGAIHFTVALILTAILVLPSRLAVALFGLLLFFMVIPLNDKNRFGRKLARFICKYACGYFPVTLHVEDIKSFDPNRAYETGQSQCLDTSRIRCYQLLYVLLLTTVVSCHYRRLRSLQVVLWQVFYTPFLRQIWTWLGLVPASRKSFYSYLKAGYSCIIVPGGVQEIIHMDHDSEVAFLKSRKGFVRIAMEMGSPLVPVFCFGQSYVYKWWKPGGRLFVQIARAIKFTPIIFWGRFGSPVPFRQPMHVVVGKPIELKKNPRPTMEEINEVHEQFIVALQELFDKYKNKAGHPDLELRVL